MEGTQLERIDTTGKVLYARFCGVSFKVNNTGYGNHKLIKHDKITPNMLKKGFIEFNGLNVVLEGKTYTQTYIRLYFDVDCIAAEDENAYEKGEFFGPWDMAQIRFSMPI